MNTPLKVLVVVLLVLFCAGSLFADGGAAKPGWPAYFFSIFLGFGTGHFYLGEDGTGFLLGDLAGLAGVVGSVAYMLVATYSLYGDFSLPSVSALQSTYLTGFAIMGAGLVVTLVSRIWEIVDVIAAVNRLTEEGRVASLSPTLDVRPGSVSLGLSYRL